MSGVLVHEWIAQSGGSENVLEAMSEIYPDSDIVCLWNDSTGRFDERRVRETWLARSPLRRSKAAALPVMPWTWRRVAGEDYDWALISSHLFAHHVNFRDPQIERYVYVHTPARYIWNPELDARGAGVAARAVAARFKGLDRRRAQEGSSFAANSEFVRRRIRDAWGVDSRVIHPPVEVEAIQSGDWEAQLTEDEAGVLDSLPETFLLGASRFIPYKRLDLVVRAGEASGMPVVLAGRGPEHARLQARVAAATVPARIVASPSDALLRALYARAAAFVFPAIEDFGIMPVEAMAAGTPVVAQAVGGAAESVVPGVTGALTTFASDAEIARAVADAVGLERDAIRAHARTFDHSRFDSAIREWVGR
ncbi:glycosyltransferase [Demequina activiva]|uniref:D-inositol 3-phosphate glycosyltransferase n=1 Tax=Demequina activiva TaxID=1582364 RepID=A0A919UFF3_9MICO|nr:glycosyltransferase [Demequina activiva]GIG53424.1 glycosyl transferase [Demequina activiva]